MLSFICKVHRKEKEIFYKYLPENSVDYCFGFWEQYKVQLKITPPRKSIFGNYYTRSGVHHITVNGNLPPQAFLVTYLHEMAHLLVRVKFKRRTLPHGQEWQEEFKKIMLPMLGQNIFRTEVENALRQHLDNPRASSCSDPELHKVLMSGENQGHHQEVLISDLSPGFCFEYESRIYILRKKLRTRFECKEIQSGRLMRFSAFVKVIPSLEMADIQEPENLIPRLETVVAGQNFKFEGQVYELKEHRRTRSLCRHIQSGRYFLINQQVEVLV